MSLRRKICEWILDGSGSSTSKVISKIIVQDYDIIDVTINAQFYVVAYSQAIGIYARNIMESCSEKCSGGNISTIRKIGGV